jgi:hypothetical protein
VRFDRNWRPEVVYNYSPLNMFNFCRDSFLECDKITLNTMQNISLDVGLMAIRTKNVKFVTEME